MVITFLSSVTPDDLLRSSLPFTYMNVDVHATDGKTHNVQLYSDISAEWVAGDHSARAQWSYGNIATDTDSTPKSFGPAPSAVSTSQASTTFGSKTAFAVPDVVAHTMVPIYAEGQGNRPTPSLNQPHPTFSPITVEAAAVGGGIAYHKVFRQTQLEFSETNQQADWGNW